MRQGRLLHGPSPGEAFASFNPREKERMSEDIFDLIIVGAGLAGSAAAYTAAKAGLEVLAVERGNFPGAKNMTGGRIYAHSMEKLIPGFAEEAPLERCVTTERVSLLTAHDAVSCEFVQPVPADPADRSYTVLREKFDQWLWGKAEEAGAQLIPGIRVDELIMRDGRVCGVKAGEDDLEARVVILADGVNSILAEKTGLAKRLSPHDCAVGVKEVLEFSPEQMRDRFNCHDGQGMAWLFAGSISEGKLGGGFLYTNENTVSLGLVFGLHGVDAVEKSVPQMLEDFRNHPVIAPLLEGGKLVEYSAHLVPEGGLRMLPKLHADGVLVAGDAAGMCINVGYTVRGMDLAIESGRLAAETVIKAKAANDFSDAALASYLKALEDSFVMKDLNLYQKLPCTLDNERVFTSLPETAVETMRALFTVNGPATPVRSKLWKQLRGYGPLNLAKDGFQFMRSM